MFEEYTNKSLNMLTFNKKKKKRSENVKSIDEQVWDIYEF